MHRNIYAILQEANASEPLENLEEMIRRHNGLVIYFTGSNLQSHNDVLPVTKGSTLELSLIIRINHSNNRVKEIDNLIINDCTSRRKHKVYVCNGIS